MQNKIYGICRNVLKITDEEIAEVKEVYEEQLNYISPLKMATTGKQRELGEHNKQVLEKLLELKVILENGAQN
ncbi:hypothetical protein C8E03_108164 [Lachnotalea glycerini]|uniref:Uncharacterized protein n=1 Tax=Lachnotalea glycerini TaxID=1763509 RepID=A0A318EK64_9FIRM|nr:hypothetical protein [Lachnotalea glycerini]OYP41516.1 hypothetical protein CG709_04815 [Lachnotalea glycerini]PXV88437.1 hypothetical protein C8E03_108164 [Lachnotalea glycerini]